MRHQSTKRVVIAVNSAWNIFNFRSGLIKALLAAGYEVIAVAPADGYEHQVSALGCRYVALPMQSQGLNPLKDAILFFRFLRLLQIEKPIAYLGYTVKPNIYGSLAAHALSIPVINNIAGLGAVFIRQNWLTVLVRRLYALALARSAKVFFQNDDDRQLFTAMALVKPEATDLVPGSGIDLNAFAPAILPSRQQPVRFLLIARMLWDKGIREFVDATRLLKQQGVALEASLLGFVGVENPAAIPLMDIQAWHEGGLVEYLGSTDDVRAHIAEAHCIVLPSYREGVPRTLLEGAAMSRPLIATDVAGCRDVVEHGVNGYLCAPRSAEALASAMLAFIRLSPQERKAMGEASRLKIEADFNEVIVFRKYLSVLSAISDGLARPEHGPL